MTKIGVDLVELKRIKQLNSKKFRERILSEAELCIYRTFKNKKRKTEYLGGRFAAKEAVAKAISYSNKGLNYQDISVLNDENGAPYIVISKMPKLTFLITISHTNKYAVAFVMLNGE